MFNHSLTTVAIIDVICDPTGSIAQSVSFTTVKWLLKSVKCT